MTIKIEGMMCQHCASRVKAALEKIPGVTAAVDLTAKTAEVTAPDSISFEVLKEAVEKAGYKAVE